MTEGGEGFDEAVLIPAGVSAWAKEIGPLVVVDSVDFFATGGKEGNHLGSDQARGAGDEEFHDCYLCGRWDGEGKGIFGPATYLTPRSRRTERTNADLEEVQMYESTNVVVVPMVSIGR